eukprot:Phypoly_transcript_02874.p1 GENE.Phypoly_transcript_02874~~Phypoly_transcript_02874.p1  ORF type:complete len:846 (+),score=138.45 Phypoly_transcript_02874:54-2591(+)
MYGSTKVHQGILEKVIKKLFPAEESVQNVRKEAKIPSSHPDNYLELDIWLPKLHICFEFQDPYHYITTWDSHVPLLVRQEVDDAKRQAVIQRGQTLITIPCWWDGSHESVAAEVNFHRPDLLISADPDDVITLNPDSDYFKKRVEGELLDIGDLMLASFPMGIAFASTISPENSWWMGEKYDGCRACWNPKKHILLSRSGNVIRLPANMVVNFEHLKSFLDGEIWMGRGDPIDSSRLSMEESDVNWALIRFVAFDNPSPRMHHKPFEKRYSTLMQTVRVDHPFVVIAQRSMCTNGKQLIKVTQELIELGGEGVILRKPGSFYVRGRSKNLVKFKASREDKEALVIELKGGECLLQLPDLSTFPVPVDAISCKMPKSGDIVSFSFQSYSQKSLPVKPEIFRIRTDLTWEGIVQEYEKEVQEKEVSQALNESSRKNLGWKPMGYWSDEAGKKKMRAIMEKFAKNELKIDPLDSAGWYRQKRSEIILQSSDVSKIVTKHAGSLIFALKNLFPEIAWDDSKFQFSPQNYWLSIDNRRQFLLRFAEQEGFDPYVAENWYSVSQDQLLNQKGGRSFLSNYSNSPFFPAMHLFPEIGLDVTKFSSVPKFYWTDVKNRRKFFEDVARKRGFDPLIPENWYSVPNIYMLSLKSVSSLLAYYNGNFPEALVQLFPDVKFEMHKFSVRKYENSGNVESQRKFFLDFAATSGFNPRVPYNWYPITPAEILAVKGGHAVLKPYGGNLGKALAHLFPEFGLDETKFGVLPPNYWESVKNRRKFFEELAKQKSMDPLLPSTWYTFPLYNIKFKKHSARVLSFHKSKIAVALTELFPEISWDKSKFQQWKNNPILQASQLE